RRPFGLRGDGTSVAVRPVMLDTRYVAGPMARRYVALAWVLGAAAHGVAGCAPREPDCTALCNGYDFPLAPPQRVRCEGEVNVVSTDCAACNNPVETREDCAAKGEVCVEGSSGCYRTCNTDRDCSMDQYCSADFKGVGGRSTCRLVAVEGEQCSPS